VGGGNGARRTTCYVVQRDSMMRTATAGARTWVASRNTSPRGACANRQADLAQLAFEPILARGLRCVIRERDSGMLHASGALCEVAGPRAGSHGQRGAQGKPAGDDAV
jgi:hypothetical protein